MKGGCTCDEKKVFSVIFTADMVPRYLQNIYLITCHSALQASTVTIKRSASCPKIVMSLFSSCLNV